MRLQCLCAGILLFLLLAACSRSNNLLLGRVEATVDTHTVVVTDCYRTSFPPPQKIEDGGTAPASYRFVPCRDADVLIRRGELFVNGRSYGRVKPYDSILVDHGVVSIHARE